MGRREFWVRAIADFERSGLTHSEFALQRKVSIDGLRSWLYKLRRERGIAPRARKKTKQKKSRVRPARKKSRGQTERKPSRVRMLPVRVQSVPMEPRSLLEVAVVGVGIRFAEGTSVHYVAALVGALRD
jgi:hypothetical protein